MTRMLMIAALFGLAVAASACTQTSEREAEGQPMVMADVPASGSSIAAPEWRTIDFRNSKAYGNNGGL
jgi:hypothetical protein